MCRHQITAVGRGPVAWEIRGRVSVSERERLVVKGAAFRLKPFDGADVQCSSTPEYQAVPLHHLLLLQYIWLTELSCLYYTMFGIPQGQRFLGFQS